MPVGEFEYAWIFISALDELSAIAGSYCHANLMWGNSLRDNDVVTVFVSVVRRICVVVETEGKWVKPERSTTLEIWVH